MLFLDCLLQFQLRQQLSSQNKKDLKQACDALAHIAAGSPSQLAALVAGDIIPPVVKLLQGDLSEAWAENSGEYATVAMR
jgi:hypothetical protein